MNIFDIIGPVMIGPSSSHTAGAARLGYVARTILGKEPVKAVIQLSGSFAQTYRGHGTDKALIAGILGFPPDDVRIRDSLSLAERQGLDFRFLCENISNAHPNTARITLTGADGSVRALSFGKTTTDGTSRYVMEQSDPSTVYIIADTLFTQMSVPIYDMCDVPLLPLLEESAIRSILIRGPENEDGTPALVTVLTTAKRDGDGGAVTSLQGSEDVTANETARALLEDIRALVFSRCVDYDPSDEALTICGFDTPPAALTVNYTTDTGVDESLSLTIGAPMLDGSGRYVRLGDSTTVYALPTAALDPLMRVAANGLDIT